MPALPNVRYCRRILPSVITTWRKLEISNFEADILSFALKIQALDFRYIDRYEITTSP
jgi:hypothetical protein